MIGLSVVSEVLSSGLAPLFDWKALSQPSGPWSSSCRESPKDGNSPLRCHLDFQQARGCCSSCEIMIACAAP